MEERKARMHKRTEMASAKAPSPRERKHRRRNDDSTPSLGEGVAIDALWSGTWYEAMVKQLRPVGASRISYAQWGHNIVTFG